jgi:hypothetical protein
MRSPASAAAAAASTPREHLSPSHDDFSFRVLVPAQAASHFNFLSQVLTPRALSLPSHLNFFSRSLCPKSRNLTIDLSKADAFAVRAIFFCGAQRCP